MTSSGFDWWEPDAARSASTGRGVHMRTWGDGYGYLLVATGRAEAMVDPVVELLGRRRRARS